MAEPLFTRKSTWSNKRVKRLSAEWTFVQGDRTYNYGSVIDCLGLCMDYMCVNSLHHNLQLSQSVYHQILENCSDTSKSVNSPLQIKMVFLQTNAQ